MTIQPVKITQATLPVQTKLAAVQKKIGFLPNLIATLGNSEAALDSYLAQSGALEGGELDGALKERIALLTADHNNCEYCLAAHSFLAQKKRVPNDVILAHGHSKDTKTEVLIQFAKDVLEKNGRVEESLLQKAKEAGYSDSQLLETVAHVSFNILTNFTNNLAGTEIDFPAVDLGEALVVNQ
jgi:uncharacterized peroxidase-related enzyme